MRYVITTTGKKKLKELHIDDLEDPPSCRSDFPMPRYKPGIPHQQGYKKMYSVLFSGDRRKISRL